MVERLVENGRVVMAGDDMGRRLRGALGNALVWGVGWSVLWVVVVGLYCVLGVLGVIPGFSWVEALWAAVRFGVPFGILKFVTGGVFSGLVGLLYRGRPLSEINWVRFGIGGGAVAAFLVPLLLQAMNLLSGDGLVPWELVLDDGLLTAVFGSVAAGGSLKLAQLSDGLLPGDDRDRLDRVESSSDSAVDARRWA